MKMSDNPDIKWALDILTPDPDYTPSLISEYGLKVAFALGGFFGACGRNKILKRPVFTGLQLHILATIVGWGVATVTQNWANNHYARRDQIIRDYIIRHPEDFPEPERKKWRDVFEPWYPIR